MLQGPVIFDQCMLSHVHLTEMHTWHKVNVQSSTCCGACSMAACLTDAGGESSCIVCTRLRLLMAVMHRGEGPHQENQAALNDTDDNDREPYS